MANKIIVSVIIRTIGREVGLKRAIDSIRKQLYPYIELIIVNDSNKILTWVEQLASGAIKTIKLINNNQQHGRSIAANIGLDHVNGEYIMFLDDDDWVDEGHIKKLLNALVEKENIILAYTETIVINENHDELGRFGAEFDKHRIILENYMPIHSVLFCANVIKHGCKFDEHLDIYEDWDFWIQLSRLGDFLYVPGISAYYVLTNGENSDAHLADKAEDGNRKIFQKWRMLWSDDEVIFLTKKAKQIENYKQIIEQNNQELTQIKASLSWRITKPLRRLREILREPTRTAFKLWNH